MKIARASLILLAVLWIGPHSVRGEAKGTKDASTKAKLSMADVVGKWDEIEGGEKVEFLSNGTFMSQSGESKFSGKYKLLADGKVQMVVNGEVGKKLGPIIRTASLADKELTLTGADGTTTKYRRPKKK